MQLKRSTIGLVAALLLAAVGGYLLYSSGGDDASEASEEQIETVPVLVTVNGIPRGTAATEISEEAWQYVGVEEIEVGQVTPGALSSLDDLENLALSGNIAVADIQSGTQLTPSLFIVPGDQATSALPEVDPTLFEVTIAMDSQRALGGDVFAGQEVAVIATFDARDEFVGGTRVVLDSVQVTNVETETLLTQEQLTNDPLAPTLATTGRIFVTFGVNVEQAEKLVFANDFGRLWLARQNKQASVDDSDLRVLNDLIDDAPVSN